jgi:hypothetical protein
MGGTLIFVIFVVAKYMRVEPGTSSAEAFLTRIKQAHSGYFDEVCSALPKASAFPQE